MWWRWSVSVPATPNTVVIHPVQLVAGPRRSSTPGRWTGPRMPLSHWRWCSCRRSGRFAVERGFSSRDDPWRQCRSTYGWQSSSCPAPLGPGHCEHMHAVEVDAAFAGAVNLGLASQPFWRPCQWLGTNATTNGRCLQRHTQPPTVWLLWSRHQGRMQKCASRRGA